MVPLANHSGCKQTKILYLKKIRVSRGKQTENRENKKSLRFLKKVTLKGRTQRCPRSAGTCNGKLLFESARYKLPVIANQSAFLVWQSLG